MTNTGQLLELKEEILKHIHIYRIANSCKHKKSTNIMGWNMAVIGKHGAAANVGDTGQTFPPVLLLVCSNDIITQQTNDALYWQT